MQTSIRDLGRNLKQEMILDISLGEIAVHLVSSGRLL